MSIATGFMVYGIIWWLVFFMALPFGIRSPEEAGEAVEPGNVESAPVKPRLWLKAGLTTLIAALLWGVYYVVAAYDLLGFRDFVRP
ncbi:MAG: DUF1467 family protein [Alphaproteobacteria bacterium]|nr:DUF1467 family protein [Alphaproteobacteria bacterium]